MVPPQQQQDPQKALLPETIETPPSTFLPPLSRLASYSPQRITTALERVRTLYFRPPPPAPIPSSLVTLLALPTRPPSTRTRASNAISVSTIHDTDTRVPDSGYASAEDEDEETPLLPAAAAAGTGAGTGTGMKAPGPRADGGHSGLGGGAEDLDEDDDGEREVLRADPLERAYAIRWLTGLICRASTGGWWVEDGEGPGDEDERRSGVLDEATEILALFTSEEDHSHRRDEEERGEGDAIVRKFVFPTPTQEGGGGGSISVELNDAQLLENDHTSVGLQSWGSSIRFAERMCASPETFSLLRRRTGGEGKKSGEPLRVLELGAGTGLLSIVAAKLLQGLASGGEVVATDCHPDVLANLRLNIGRNFSASTSSPSTRIKRVVHTLDWESPSFAPPLDEKFDLILAADCIYEPEHARWIRKCVERMLSEDGVFWMIMALRPSGRHEGLERTVSEEFSGDGGGKRLVVLEMMEEEKQEGIGRADEAGYRIFRIGLP